MPAAMKGFPGFPADFFRFFEELAANNNRPWFNESKERYYESVVNPISEFIVCMTPRLKTIHSPSGLHLGDVSRLRPLKTGRSPLPSALRTLNTSAPPSTNARRATPR